jgi:hypothetical protein
MGMATLIKTFEPVLRKTRIASRSTGSSEATYTIIITISQTQGRNHECLFGSSLMPSCQRYSKIAAAALRIETAPRARIKQVNVPARFLDSNSLMGMVASPIKASKIPIFIASQ